jgi:hypothetical protein
MPYTYPLRGWKYHEGTGSGAPPDRTRRTGRNRPPEPGVFAPIDSFNGRKSRAEPIGTSSN